MNEYAAARQNMVSRQLRPNRVEHPRVLEAMGSVPRELFLPKRLRGSAYIDEDIGLGNGRHLIEPLVLARMAQATAIGRDDVVLVVGCDTGYVAAVASKLAATVFLLARPEYREEVEKLLDDQGFDNVVVQTGSSREGLPSQAPFNVILLAGAVSEVPAVLLEQLEHKGRLGCVVQDDRQGKLTVVTRFGDAYGRLTPFDARIPELDDLRQKPAFTF